MNLLVPPGTEADRLFAFEVKRAALGAYVTQTWGWDEACQRAFHATDWAAHHPDVVELDGAPIGTIELVEHADYFVLGEFYLLPAYQRRAIGTALLRRALARADGRGVPTRLQFLKVNPVRSLYERHGFRITGESATHFFAQRDTPTPSGAPDA